MQKLYQVIREAFALSEETLLNEKTFLREIPGWDSMNAINLEMALEATFGINPASLKITDDTSLIELHQQIQSKL